MQKHPFTLALFYCRNTPGGSEQERQALEEEYRAGLRLFPLPCSGRMEPSHLMKALEEFADAAYLVACPEGACRYHEGNKRAGKRVARTAEILEEIGLEKERVGIVVRVGDDSESLGSLARRIMGEVEGLGRSQVHRPGGKRAGGKIAAKKNRAPSRAGRQASRFDENGTAETAQMEQR